MVDREKVIKGLKCCFENANCDGCPYETECRKISFKTPENHCPILDDILALLKEQKDMIQIQTVAEYIAQYTAPPVRSPLAVYGDLVKAWERFLDGLRKSENKND